MSDPPSRPKRPPPPPPAPPNKRIDGRYELVEVAGRGGMAIVWRARHHGPGRFQRTVAVKQMHTHLRDDESYRELFREEARVGSVLQDPNIAQVYDFVEDEGQYYLILEWVSGVDMATYIRFVHETRGDNTRWERMAAVVIGVLRGLAAAHGRTAADGSEEPIVHRDVSPNNILIGDNGHAKLIDFGLSFSRDRDIEDTDPGMAKGKLSYLAPEIVRGGRPTPRSDQFAVGSVLWEALVGRRAFTGDNDFATYQRLANAQLDSLAEARPDIPAELVALVEKALALDPDARFESTHKMAQALGEVLKDYGSSSDLYAGLSGTVEAARAVLGGRTQDPAVESSIPVLHSGMVTLHVDENDKPAGFSRWLPNFIRNLTQS